MAVDHVVMINRLAARRLVYIVSGNNYTKCLDLLSGAKVDGYFCNNADELRDKAGRLIWSDTSLPNLPVVLEKDLHYRLNDELKHGRKIGANCIDWRSPRFLNFSLIGRYADAELRSSHDASWRDGFIETLGLFHPGVEIVKGGKVSIDIYTKGADKGRAALYSNAVLNRPFVFFGDRTMPGGNDFPVAEYCKNNPQNICLTVDSPEHTFELLDKFLD